MSGIKFFLAWGMVFLATCFLPAQPQKPIILLGGTVHTGTGQVMEQSAVGIENGKITFVADARTIRIDTNGAHLIDVQGKHIYPGLIAPITTVGLTELDQARPTHDYNEVGLYNPNVRSLIAYNTDSKIIPTLRFNGIQLVQSVPSGGIISGTSSIMSLNGWNWEDAVYKADDGIHVGWPQMYYSSGWWAEPGDNRRNKNWEKEVDALYQFFGEAKSYAAQEKPLNANLRLEAMKGIFDSTQTLYINVDFVRDLLSAIEFIEEFKIKAVIVGGRDAWMIADELAKKKIPVILYAVHSLPGQADDDVDQPFKNAALLNKAGVQYCLSLSGSWQQRNLMFMAGTTVIYGVSKEDALKSITSSTARILGIEATTGSIEVGKDANIIVSDGDIMEMKESNVIYSFIKGVQIPLDDHQQELYHLYMRKFGFE